jgi:hypothetical protein
MLKGMQVGRARTYTWLGTAALGASALAYIGAVDPHRPGAVFPFCPFKFITGWNCPACGGLRMTHDVLHGDVAAAAVDNVFLLIGLPVLALWAAWRVRRGQQVFTTPVLVVIAVASVAWTIVRNLPGFPLVPTMFNS